jgi:cephalosporin hydroxylase
MDLSKVKLIHEFPTHLLENQSAVEELLFKVGLNAENAWELPTQMIKSNGGLKIWQYPNQFSKYITFLASLKPKSYLEIGCRWGGTFIFTREFMNKVNKLEESVAIDLIESPVNVSVMIKIVSLYS